MPENFSKNKRLIVFQWFIIVVFSLLILLFIKQNISLKNVNTAENRQNPKLKASLFEKKLNELFLFKAFPLKLNQDKLVFSKEFEMPFINGYIAMVFDLTVCGKCLNDELIILNRLKENAFSNNIAIIAIIGISDKNEEAEIINRYRSGEIFFPCKMITTDSLYNTFKLDKENYLDTPFYLYLSHEFKVLNIFKPPYLDTKELNAWLKIVTTQVF